MKQPGTTRHRRGFSHAASLMQAPIRKAGEGRGFAVARLLTHWADIVGATTAQMATPVKVGYGRGGIGATLTILAEGPQAPLVDMQKDQIRDKVNACYGYNAIARVRITQTAPSGFADAQRAFAPAPVAPKTTTAAQRRAAGDLSNGVRDEQLRAALTALGANILMKQQSDQR